MNACPYRLEKTPLETSLVEWKRGPCKGRVHPPPIALETSLVEWKLKRGVIDKLKSLTLETSLVEWKRIGDFRPGHGRFVPWKLP